MVRIDEITVVRPDRGITSDSVDEFAAVLDRICKRPGITIIVDLANVDILTTPGISLMLEAQQKLKASGGILALTRPQPTVAGVLRRLRLSEVLETVDGIDQAVQLTGRA